MVRLTVPTLHLLGESAPRQRKPHEIAAALAVTALVHGAMVMAIAFLDSRPKPQPLDSWPTVEAVLIGSAGKSARQSQQLENELRQQLNSESPAFSSDERSSTSLNDLWGEAESNVTSPVQKSRGTPFGRVASPDALVALPRNRSGTAPVLPCWRLPPRPLPVTLIIALDKRGAVVGAPKIVRQTASAAQPWAAVEAEAMAAMSGCAPYAPPSVAGMYRTLELDFRRRNNWVAEGELAEFR